ncbi:nebulette-like isoform X2 [Scyliorhinus torazame]|uniref:nebulette-like isoform X2 n=1 Tax=Scyliorhinus torazame TaxID=75743 RepID=UPI003B5A846E
MGGGPADLNRVLYKEEVGPGTAVKETPEMKRVKENQQNISVVKYKDEVGQGTAVPDLYDLKQIKENQKNISLVKYKDQVGTGTAVSVTLEMERAKRNQSNVSSVLYSNDLKKMKGRPIQLLDTPEMRRVRETQNNISMIKYHEDFERTRGKGFTSVSDDLVTERARKNTQFVSDAMYKGVHPHVVEMEKSRSGIMGEFKVWRTDPGSIFDFDPLEDNIQSRSLHLLSEKAKLCSKQSQSTGVGSISVGDEKSEMTELNTSISSYSEQTMEFSGERAAVLPGAYQQMHSPHSPGYGYMHQSSVSSMRPQHSLPHTINMRTYRAMYDYTAADEDEVSFKDGDYIINVQAIDEGWMYGTVQRTGKTGMLPANYVEPLH